MPKAKSGNFLLKVGTPNLHDFKTAVENSVTSLVMIMTSFIGGDDIKEKASSLCSGFKKGKKNFHMVGFSWGRTRTIGKYYLGELNAITIHIPLCNLIFISMEWFSFQLFWKIFSIF